MFTAGRGVYLASVSFNFWLVFVGQELWSYAVLLTPTKRQVGVGVGGHYRETTNTVPGGRRWSQKKRPLIWSLWQRVLSLL